MDMIPFASYMQKGGPTIDRDSCLVFVGQVAAVDKPQLHMWETGVMRITR